MVIKYQVSDKMIKQIKKSSLILAAFALATTAVVTATHILTAPKIKEQQRLATLKTLDEIIPSSLYDNQLTEDCTVLTDANNNQVKVFRARQNSSNNLTNSSANSTINSAAAIETIVPDGYSGRIDLLVAVDANGKVLGVRTTNHKETPGLGDKIELAKSDWITTFNNRTVAGEDDSRWTVRKDGGTFDQFTGATITPRAVVKGVKKTVLWFKSNPDAFFQAANNCQTQ